MTGHVSHRPRLVAAASLFTAHLICYIVFAALGRIRPIEFFNVLLLCANGIIGVMVVTDEEYFGALSQLPFEKTLNTGYDAAGSGATVQGIILLKEAPEHIKH